MNKREFRSIKLCCAAQCKAWELETLLVHSHKVLLFGEREIFQLTKAVEVFSSHELIVKLLLSKRKKKKKMYINAKLVESHLSFLNSLSWLHKSSPAKRWFQHKLFSLAKLHNYLWAHCRNLASRRCFWASFFFGWG